MANTWRRQAREAWAALGIESNSTNGVYSETLKPSKNRLKNELYDFDASPDNRTEMPPSPHESTQRLSYNETTLNSSNNTITNGTNNISVSTMIPQIGKYSDSIESLRINHGQEAPNSSRASMVSSTAHPPNTQRTSTTNTIHSNDKDFSKTSQLQQEQDQTLEFTQERITYMRASIQKLVLSRARNERLRSQCKLEEKRSAQLQQALQQTLEHMQNKDNIHENPQLSQAVDRAYRALVRRERQEQHGAWLPSQTNSLGQQTGDQATIEKAMSTVQHRLEYLSELENENVSNLSEVLSSLRNIDSFTSHLLHEDRLDVIQNHEHSPQTLHNQIAPPHEADAELQEDNIQNHTTHYIDTKSLMNQSTSNKDTFSSYPSRAIDETMERPGRARPPPLAIPSPTGLHPPHLKSPYHPSDKSGEQDRSGEQNIQSTPKMTASVSPRRSSTPKRVRFRNTNTEERHNSSISLGDGGALDTDRMGQLTLNPHASVSPAQKALAASISSGYADADHSAGALALESSADAANHLAALRRSSRNVSTNMFQTTSSTQQSGSNGKISTPSQLPSDTKRPSRRGSFRLPTISSQNREAATQEGSPRRGSTSAATPKHTSRLKSNDTESMRTTPHRGNQRENVTDTKTDRSIDNTMTPRSGQSSHSPRSHLKHRPSYTSNRTRVLYSSNVSTPASTSSSTRPMRELSPAARQREQDRLRMISPHQKRIQQALASTHTQKTSANHLTHSKSGHRVLNTHNTPKRTTRHVNNSNTNIRTKSASARSRHGSMASKTSVASKQSFSSSKPLRRQAKGSSTSSTLKKQENLSNTDPKQKLLLALQQVSVADVMQNPQIAKLLAQTLRHFSKSASGTDVKQAATPPGTPIISPRKSSTGMKPNASTTPRLPDNRNDKRILRRSMSHGALPRQTRSSWRYSGLHMDIVEETSPASQDLFGTRITSSSVDHQHQQAEGIKQWAWDEIASSEKTNSPESGQLRRASNSFRMAQSPELGQSHRTSISSRNAQLPESGQLRRTSSSSRNAQSPESGQSRRASISSGNAQSPESGYSHQVSESTYTPANVHDMSYLRQKVKKNLTNSLQTNTNSPVATQASKIPRESQNRLFTTGQSPEKNNFSQNVPHDSMANITTFNRTDTYVKPPQGIPPPTTMLDMSTSYTSRTNQSSNNSLTRTAQENTAMNQNSSRTLNTTEPSNDGTNYSSYDPTDSALSDQLASMEKDASRIDEILSSFSNLMND